MHGWRCCSAVDESVGRIVATLEEAGPLDRTVIVFTSDHGYFYGEHDLNEERRLAYEETIRIPLIVRFPPVAKAGATPARAGADDRPCADPPRTGRRHRPDGPTGEVTRAADARGAASRGATSILIEYYSDTVFPRIRNMGYRAVRTQRHKYIHYLELPGMDELYDLEADPYELDNLFGSPREPELLPAMQAELARLERETGYPPAP